MAMVIRTPRNPCPLHLLSQAAKARNDDCTGRSVIIVIEPVTGNLIMAFFVIYTTNSLQLLFHVKKIAPVKNVEAHRALRFHTSAKSNV
jgi:hypothetical protein